MGLLNDAVAAGAQALGLGDLFKRKTRPKFVENDFPDGLEIIELINGNLDNKNKVQLRGVFAPHAPQEYGGEQRVLKEYYPGNSEPSVQVLGDREKDTTYRGRLKSKFFKEQDLREIANEMSLRLEEMRRAGRVCRFKLGERVRYGIIEDQVFRMRNLTDIEYEIRVINIGPKPPKDAKLTVQADDGIKPANRDLLNRANEQITKLKNIPAEMPRSLSDLINDAIGEVASVISTVTGFVDGIISDAEQLQQSANRAIGLIQNARKTISRQQRRVGALSRSVSNLGSSFSDPALKASASVKNGRYIGQYQRTSLTLSQLLAVLQERFALLRQTVPLVRHKVQEGDTLQKLAMRYYSNADLWKKIQDHNKLRDPNLVKGTVLEIPKQ